MIIFDLDGTLANIEHRRNLVQPHKNPNYEWRSFDAHTGRIGGWYHKTLGCKFIPDYEAFEDYCDEDTPNEPVVFIWNMFEVDISLNRCPCQIWSGRSDRVRKKTIDWLDRHLFGIGKDFWDSILKMRPTGDFTPDEQIKEHWLNEYLATGGSVQMVFDDRNKVVDMWRRRSIPCFQVAEGDF